MALENLRVRLSADTRDLEDGIDDAQSQLSDFTATTVTTRGGIEQLESGLDSLQNQVLGLTGGMQLLQSSTDEAEDEMSSLSRSTMLTSGNMFGLGVSVSNVNIGMLALSGSIATTLIPLLVILSTIIAPIIASTTVLIATLGSLAAVFGTIVGSGLIAWGKELAEQNEEQLGPIEDQIEQLQELRENQGSLTDAQERLLTKLKEKRDSLEEATSITGALADKFGELQAEITPIIVELGQRFVPLIKDAFNAIPVLVRNMVQAIGPLDQFTQTLREWGNLAMRVIPQIVSGMVDLARRALPAARSFVNWLANNGGKAFRRMETSFNRILPALVDFLDALMRFTPVALRVGETVMNILTPVLSTLLNMFSLVGGALDVIPNFVKDIITWFTTFVGKITAVTAVLFGIASILETVITLFGGVSGIAYVLGVAVGAIEYAIPWLLSLTNPITALIGLATAFLAAYTTNFLGFRDLVNSVVDQVMSFLNGFIRWVRTEAALMFANAMAAFVGGAESVINTAFSIGSNIWNYISSFVGSLVSYFADGTFYTDIVNAVDSLISGIVGVFEGAFELGGTVINIISGFVGRLTNYLARGKFYMDITNAVGSFVDGIVDMLTGAARGAVSLGTKFVNAFSNAIDDLADYFLGTGQNSAIGDIIGALYSFADKVGTIIRDAINDAIPNSIGFEIPEAEIPGVGTIGGDSIQLNLPNNPVPPLQSGGFIEQGGLAMLHAGEQVVPAAEVDRNRGGTTIRIENIHASGREEGREAGRAFADELRSQGI